MHSPTAYSGLDVRSAAGAAGTSRGVNEYASTTTDAGHAATSSGSGGSTANGDAPVIYSCEVAGTGSVTGIAMVPEALLHTAQMTPRVHAAARQQAGAPSGASVTCGNVHSTSHGPDPAEWIAMRMAPNCARGGYATRNVTTYNKFTCWYEGEGTIDGKRVRRPFYHVDGTLASCDGMQEYGKISDDVMSAIQKYAYFKAGGDESELDPTKFVCTVQSLPFQ